MSNSKEKHIGIIMGSDSDLDVMTKAAEVLDTFGLRYEVRIVSAHRTPQWMSEYASTARGRGLKILIAGAGGSAHLPGMTASETTLPVLAVPIKRSHHGDEALHSSSAMPPGIPLAVMPVNGADRAALFAVRILALQDASLLKKYESYIADLKESSLAKDQKIQKIGWQKYNLS